MCNTSRFTVGLNQSATAVDYDPSSDQSSQFNNGTTLLVSINSQYCETSKQRENTHNVYMSSS